MKYRKGVSYVYLYLLMIILFGLILSTFIKPFMEGFKEGVEKNSCPEGWTQKNGKCFTGNCDSGYRWDTNNRVCKDKNGNEGKQLNDDMCKKQKNAPSGVKIIFEPSASKERCAFKY